jgi:hypothetical protein
MKKITISILLVLGAHQAKAESAFVRSLERNQIIANQILIQEKNRLIQAERSYEASYRAAKSAKKILARAKQDELRQDQQMRSMISVNSGFDKFPDYRYDGSSTGLRYTK